MNRGLLVKAFRELWPIVLLFGVGLALVEALLAYVIPTFQEQIAGQIFQLEVVRRIVGAMIGTEMNGAPGPEMFVSICWVHPVVFALTWAYVIVCCTRVPAGEIDRGTVDVLLGLPVSRLQVLVCETAACVMGLAVVIACGYVGNLLSSLNVAPPLRGDPWRMALAAAHLGVLAGAVGGVAWLISALSDRRGKAMTLAFVLVLASFLLNYLAQFWEPARRVSWLSLLTYFRPLFILRDGTAPIGDAAVLLAIGAAAWGAAAAIFVRRDLSTL